MDLGFDEQMTLSDNARGGTAALKQDLVSSLTPAQQELVFSAFLMLEELSKGLEVPQFLQLVCLLALKQGKDVVRHWLWKDTQACDDIANPVDSGKDSDHYLPNKALSGFAGTLFLCTLYS
jgi:hypothetical protein